MASGSKRSWKLQELVAHNANVNCLALGHKSGRVMVTGGDDKNVNLWAIGKESCFMSLSGHTTPIECVQFNHVEELVCAGSRSGALKVWDLEAAKLVRTLIGHREAIRCIDFHPYGDFLASGSADCAIKIWDSRKKGCIFTYAGHKEKVNSIKFSPDGQWIASGGDDYAVKIWDVRIGKVLKEFTEHVNSVTCVEFHPHEFLLATGGTDRTVHFFDLENFNLVSSERDLGSVRCLWFNPDGECLFTGVRDHLKVVGWEPTRVYDSVSTNWGRICDISTVHNQVVGASFHLTNVMVYVADLKKIQPFGGPVAESPSPFTPNQSLRKSFSKAERPVSLRNRNISDVNTIEESTSGTDPEEESPAFITNQTDYQEIFKGRGLTRTPPPPSEPFIKTELLEPDYGPQILGEHIENFEALSLDHNINYRRSPSPTAVSTPSPVYSRSKSNLDQTFASKTTKNQQQERENNSNSTNKLKVQPANKFNLQRQSSCKESNDNKVPKNNYNMKHSVSEVNLNKNTNSLSRNNSRKNSFSKPSKNSSVPNVSKIPMTSKNTVPVRPNNIYSSANVEIYDSPQLSPNDDDVRSEEIVPAPIDRPVGLLMDDFLPKTHQSFGHQQQMLNMCAVPNNFYDSTMVDIYNTSKLTRNDDEIIPFSIDKPIGLLMDDFLPKTHQTFGHQQQMPNMSEAEVLSVVMGGHDPMFTVLLARQRSLKIVMAQYRNKDAKSAFEMAVALKDNTIIVDLLGVFNAKSSMWNLDMCVIILPKIEDLLQSKYESYITTGCDTLKLILKSFGPVIKTNIACPAGSFGVDIPREERYRKSVKCHESLESIRTALLKKHTIPSNIANTFKEIQTMIRNTLD